MNHVLGSCLLSFNLLIGAAMLAGASVVSAGQDQADTTKFDIQPPKIHEKSSWAIGFDNDVLVPGSRDQDYTYGINLTYAGNRAENQWASLHQPLDWINQRVGLDDLLGSGIKTSKIEYGLFGFTPEDITQSEANQDDRPYSSLVYVSSTREHYDRSSEVSWQTTLTLGIMGLSVVGDIQEIVHSTYGGSKPRGWANQISDGGEPTARYSISRQSLVHQSVSGMELKSTFQGSLGYITEASWSLSTRAGKFHTPWVSFNPELTSYGEKSIPNVTAKVSEQYVWAGISFKLRAYNAFLEGQFKDSAVTYSGDEINRGIVEAWVGYTLALTDGYSFTYSIRGHTSELKQGSGNRNVLWGGVLISKTID